LPVLIVQFPLDSQSATLSHVVVLAAEAGLPPPTVRATATVLTPVAPARSARVLWRGFLCMAM
jgi:hypothetical protein